MTPEDMRFEIESVFRGVLEIRKPSVRTGQDVPAGVTPMSWHLAIAPAAEEATVEEFREKYAGPAGETLAMEGLGYGCTRFGRLTVRDREEAQVKGHMKTHKRPRVFIVHAFGWKGDAL